MPIHDEPLSRRDFLGGTLALGAGALHQRALADAEHTLADGAASTPLDLPLRVFVDHDGKGLVEARRAGTRWTTAQGTVELTQSASSLTVRVSAPGATLARVVLRWPATYPATSLYLGDAWERGYGDLQWRFLQPERVMPWYFAAHDTATGAPSCTA